MELFLVITILSVITLITFPLLRRPLNESVVQDAGQQLLRDLSAARTSAIESGRPILFQFQAGSGRYYIGEQDQRLEAQTGSKPKEGSQLDLLAKGDSRDTLSGSGERGAQRVPKPSPLKLQRELPAEVIFVDTSLEEDNARTTAFSNRPAGTETGRDRQKRVDAVNAENLSPEERTPQETPRQRSEEKSVDSLQWSAPVRFYPSGRIKPGKVPLESPDGVRADLEIMGLAGRIRLSTPQKRRSED